MIKLIISEPSILLKAKLNSIVNEVIDEKNDFNYNVFDFEETPVDEIIDEDSNFIEKKISMNFKLTRVEKRRIREVELTIVSE